MAEDQIVELRPEKIAQIKSDERIKGWKDGKRCSGLYQALVDLTDQVLYSGSSVSKDRLEKVVSGYKAVYRELRGLALQYQDDDLISKVMDSRRDFEKDLMRHDVTLDLGEEDGN